MCSPVATAVQRGRELDLKEPVLFLQHRATNVTSDIVSDLYPQPGAPRQPLRPSSLHLDELSPRRQLPLGSSEVKQDDRSATLGQAGTQAKAQVAPSSRHQDLLPRGLHGCGLRLLLWCWWRGWLTGFEPSRRPYPWSRHRPSSWLRPQMGSGS